MSLVFGQLGPLIQQPWGRYVRNRYQRLTRRAAGWAVGAI